MQDQTTQKDKVELDTRATETAAAVHDYGTAQDFGIFVEQS